MDDMAVMDDLGFDMEEEEDTSSPFLHVDDDSVAEYPPLPPLDGDSVVDDEVSDLHFAVSPAPFSALALVPLQQRDEPELTFRRHMVDGNPVLAASLLVARALFQTHTISPQSFLPLPNIMLFLYLAKLVISSGTLQQHNLSRLLSILYPYAVTCEPDWAPMPTTISGFRSRILNVSNSNSMVSILPIPSPETLPDGHGYTPFRNILSHALMMKKFESSETKDPKWQSIASSKKFESFLHSIPPTDATGHVSPRQIAVGIIVWTDGWDTSTGCKSNRSPMHTGTVTLLFVDVKSKEVVGIATYPNMGGPGKIDHEPAFRRFQEDMALFESDGCDRVFSSRHFSSDVEIHTQVMFVVQDQPERRGASGLLGGGSTLHPLYGMSCDFKRLETTFVACKDCESNLYRYLEAKDWTKPPLDGQCTSCLGWSLDRLQGAAYKSGFDPPNHLTDDTPGAHLFTGAGRLPSELLILGWNHCIDMFAIKHKWTEADVKKYLQQLCLNDATIVGFVDSCRRHVYLKDTAGNPGDYTNNEVELVRQDAHENPSRYELPRPPAMWLLASTDEKTEGAMHLSMGIQKAVFKFIIRWASENKKGTALQRRLALNLSVLQDLKLTYCPCRPFKDDKFGGYTAEGHRALTMVSTTIFRCLLENDLEPPPPRGPNRNPQKEWLRQDNINWMYLRDVEHSSSITAPEAREQVRVLLAKRRKPAIVNRPREPITVAEIRDLIWRMFNMFRAIFCTDLSSLQAKNRSTAAVMRFLCHIESLDSKLNPKRAKPIWIAKFNFLGLLRICESFEHYQHVRNLYEGGVIGEGIVKVLRPLVANGVHTRRATNLLLKHYRQFTLDMLIDATEGNTSNRRVCPLGDDVEISKFKRYTTAAEVVHRISKGLPLAAVLYGSSEEWKAGVIIVSQNRWYFREISFGQDEEVVDDEYGLSYHSVRLLNNEICLGEANGDFAHTLGDDPHLRFWDYAIVVPDILETAAVSRYGILRSNWQYLDQNCEWSNFD